MASETCPVDVTGMLGSASMRLGCGCLFWFAFVIAAIAALGWAGYEALADPGVPHVATTAADSQRAQEKLYSIATRSARRGSSVVLSEAELNAFLARNLDTAAMPLTDMRLSLAESGRFHFASRTTIDRILSELPLSAVRDAVPSAWRARPVWLHLVAVPKVESGEGRRRYIRLHVERFAIGRQRLPGIFVRLILDPGTVRLLRWSVPETVEDVRIEPGRAVVRLAS